MNNVELINAMAAFASFNSDNTIINGINDELLQIEKFEKRYLYGLPIKEVQELIKTHYPEVTI